MERNAAIDAVFQPVRPPTTFEETVERLGTAIRLGLLVPGAKLPPERELATDICRAPARAGRDGWAVPRRSTVSSKVVGGLTG